VKGALNYEFKANGQFYIAFEDFQDAFNAIDITTILIPPRTKKTDLKISTFKSVNLISQFQGKPEEMFAVYCPDENGVPITLEFTQSGFSDSFSGRDVLVNVVQWSFEEVSLVQDEDTNEEIVCVDGVPFTSNVIARINPTVDTRVSVHWKMFDTTKPYIICPQLRYAYQVLPSTTSILSLYPFFNLF
jgi:hypothetical protein